MTHVLKRPISLRGHFKLLPMLVAFSLGPLLAVIGFIYLYILAELENTYERRLQEDIELVARAIKKPLLESLKTDDYDGLKQSLNSVEEIRRIYGIYLYNSDGFPIRIDGQDEPLHSSKKLSAIAKSGRQQREYAHSMKREVYSYFLPLADSTGHYGLLEVTRKKSDITRHLQEIRAKGAKVFVIIIIMTVFLITIFYVLAVARPIKNLLKGMKKVGKGELNYRMEPQGPQEVYQLGDAFNSMLEEMEQTQSLVAKQQEEKFKLQTQMEKTEKFAAIGRLAGEVAHEMGTPLSYIDGKAQRAVRKIDQGQTVDYSSYFEGIRDEAQKMGEIIRRLLNISGPRKITKTTVSMRKLVDEAVHTVCPSPDIGIDVQAEDPSQHSLLVTTDTARLQQVLVNILKNANDAAPHPNGIVRLIWCASQESLSFTIEDNGNGIPDSKKQQILEPFFTTKDKGLGSGLGLAISVGIITEFGGKIHVEDSPWGGARFRVILPYSEELKVDRQ